MITINTVAELRDLIDTTDMPTFVGMVTFAGELLTIVRENGNEIAIDDNLGFCDDGGFIQIDDAGCVVYDFAIL